MAFFTYIVECADGTYYTGWTDNLQRRVDRHNSGKGARYTRARTPVRLIACWEFPTKQEAMSHEWHVKQLSRSDKLRLIVETQSGIAVTS